jgi:adenylate kinase
VLLAPPGGGKSTQAGRLAEWLGVPHLALGDALRRAVERGTDLGRQARPYMEEGRLVPDEVIIPVVVERLREDGPDPGYVLDGFPRDLAQARALDDEAGVGPDAVVFLSIPDDEVVARLSGRRACPNGHPWHVEHDPPSEEGVCDTCGEPLHRRDDDHPDAVRRRLAVYRDETEPLVRQYRDRDLLVEVDGTSDPDTVAERIRKALRRRPR